MAVAYPFGDKEQLVLPKVLIVSPRLEVEFEMVTVDVSLHPALSSTTQVKLPADKPEMVTVVAPPGDHK